MGIPPPIHLDTISMPDTLILMVLALVVFGPRRLPKIGRQLGKLMYEFRKASNDFKFQMEEELRQAEEADRRQKEEEERQRALAAALGREIPERTNSLLLLLAELTVTAAPLAVRLAPRAELDPTLTLPKASVVGETARVPAAVPVPESAMAAGNWMRWRRRRWIRWPRRLRSA